VGPGASGYLTHRFNYQVPILCAAALSFLSIMGTTFLLPAVPPHPEDAAKADEGPVGPGGKRLKLLDWGNYLQYFRRPVLGGFLIEFFLFMFAFATFTSGFALFAERRLTWHGAPFGPKEVGYMFMYSGFLGIIVQSAMRQGALVNRIGEIRLVTLGLLCAAVGYGLLGFSHGIALLLVAAGFASFGNGVLRPALTSLITQQVTRSEQGVVLGLTQSLLSVAQIVAPAIAGGLIDQGHLTLWALWAGLVMAIALLLNFRAREARLEAHAA
jgi:MFS family permease